MRSNQQSNQQCNQPPHQPTIHPSIHPSIQPSNHPTTQPLNQPTKSTMYIHVSRRGQRGCMPPRTSGCDARLHAHIFQTIQEGNKDGNEKKDATSRYHDLQVQKAYTLLCVFLRVMKHTAFQQTNIAFLQSCFVSKLFSQNK